MKRVLIVGGGITGLSAAYYLQKDAPSLQITLFEKSDHLGGKIHTERSNGFIMERGPDSVLSRKKPILDLIHELDLEREVVGTNPNARKNDIYRNNKLHVMPKGLNLGVPTEFMPFVKTNLISSIGKLRAGFDLFLPPKQDDLDESLGSFLTRRLGKQVAENLAEPLLSGIYAGDTQQLSLRATFPQFHEQEIRYGSVIKGMLASKKRASTIPQRANQSVFINFRKGLSTLVERLTEQLQGIDLFLNEAVEDITRVEDGYIVSSTHHKEMRFDSVLLAVPAFDAKRFVPNLPDIPYVSVANILLGFHRKDIDHPLDASGFVIPRNEGRNITACTWTSSKWSHTAPEEYVVLRCYIGHAKDQRLLTLPDSALIEMAYEDLKQILGIQATPVFSRLTRLHHSMPQYTVGHLERLNAFRVELAKSHPHLYVAGAAYEGVGIPDCIGQGKAAAHLILKEA